MTNPHGLVLGPREFGHFRDALRTDDKKVHAAPPEFVARARELLAEPRPQAPDGYPFQLANRRNRHSMNSWLNELPGLHPSGKRNQVIINPEDAAALGIADGDAVRVFSSVGEIEAGSVAQRSAPPRRGDRRSRLGLKDLRPATWRRAGVLRRQPESAHRQHGRRSAVADLTVEFVLRRVGGRSGRPPALRAGGPNAPARRQTCGPSARRSSTLRIASRNLPSHSSACSPTSLTDHASASDRDRATPASTSVSSTWRSG